MSELAVVICGTGIAGAEGVLRLRRLAGDRCRITILDPDEEFAYRPLAVREPFAIGHVRRYPIARLAEDVSARRIQDAVAAVDIEQRTLTTAAGLELPYDALLLALGGRQRAPFEHAHVFTDRNAGETFHGIV
ncbi:MAG TPA: FAD-dependent oxidoreductase, partial [Solirubrobacteraceae bacterium]|nr:FAD-dependent oxidoreductase [Solirubrobacteraceae bacterium]